MKQIVMHDAVTHAAQFKKKMSETLVSMVTGQPLCSSKRQYKHASIKVIDKKHEKYVLSINLS